MATRARLLAFLALFLLLASATADGEINPAAVPFSGELGWNPAWSGCRGTVAECTAGDKSKPGSESARRVLYGWGYISYWALMRDFVPCYRRGYSYYNCRPWAYANPYTRGCSRITRCRW